MIALSILAAFAAAPCFADKYVPDSEYSKVYEALKARESEITDAVEQATGVHLDQINVFPTRQLYLDPPMDPNDFHFLVAAHTWYFQFRAEVHETQIIAKGVHFQNMDEKVKAIVAALTADFNEFSAQVRDKTEWNRDTAYVGDPSQMGYSGTRSGVTAGAPAYFSIWTELPALKVEPRHPYVDYERQWMRTVFMVETAGADNVVARAESTIWQQQTVPTMIGYFMRKHGVVRVSTRFDQTDESGAPKFQIDVEGIEFRHGQNLHYYDGLGRGDSVNFVRWSWDAHIRAGMRFLNENKLQALPHAGLGVQLGILIGDRFMLKGFAETESQRGARAGGRSGVRLWRGASVATEVFYNKPYKLTDWGGDKNDLRPEGLNWLNSLIVDWD